MLDEAERVFSAVKRTISRGRARLRTLIVEMTELLDNWNKNDLIQELHVSLEDNEVINVFGSDENSD